MYHGYILSDAFAFSGVSFLRFASCAGRQCRPSPRPADRRANRVRQQLGSPEAKKCHIARYPARDAANRPVMLVFTRARHKRCTSQKVIRPALSAIASPRLQASEGEFTLATHISVRRSRAEQQIACSVGGPLSSKWDSSHRCPTAQQPSTADNETSRGRGRGFAACRECA